MVLLLPTWPFPFFPFHITGRPADLCAAERVWCPQGAGACGGEQRRARPASTQLACQSGPCSLWQVWAGRWRPVHASPPFYSFRPFPRVCHHCCKTQSFPFPTLLLIVLWLPSPGGAGGPAAANHAALTGPLLLCQLVGGIGAHCLQHVAPAESPAAVSRPAVLGCCTPGKRIRQHCLPTTTTTTTTTTSACLLLHPLRACLLLQPLRLCRGSEVVDNAMKIARAHTGRQNIIAFDVSATLLCVPRPACISQELTHSLLPYLHTRTQLHTCAHVNANADTEAHSTTHTITHTHTHTHTHTRTHAGWVPRAHPGRDGPHYQQDHLQAALWASGAGRTHCPLPQLPALQGRCSRSAHGARA